MNKVDIIARTSLFENISKISRQTLADICLSKHMKKKDILFHEGDAGCAVYILVTGAIQLHKMGTDGRDIVIRVIKPGEIFGEVVLFEKNNYPVTAIALKTSMVYVIPKNQFVSLLKDEGFARDFFGTLMNKMRYLAQRIHYLTAFDVEERLFLFLEDHYGRALNISPTISKKDIASAIGTTPETFSRLLLKLKNEKKLSWEGKVIHIPESVWQNRPFDS